MKRLISICLLLAVTGCTVNQRSSTSAQELTVDNGMSVERLERIEPAMQRYIDQGKLVGVMTLVARNGEVVHYAAQGMQNRETQEPLSRDTIFRIYSMTKPITAVAALTLWEQGKFHMNDPITKYFPELSDLKVYVSGEGDNMVLEDAKYPIRIIDLFTHTAGFSYGFSNSEVDKRYQQLAKQKPPENIDQALKQFASLPLNHQPGTAWNYSISTDLIGFLVERISGKKLGDYMQEVIFDPLNMQDSGFVVPPEKLSRFAQVYIANKQGETVIMEQEPLGNFKSEPAIHNGGGGMVSTMDDYLKFAQMLLNGGELNGVRILGPKTVEYMGTNHLQDKLIPFNQNSAGEGYGLAVSVTVDPGQVRFLSSKGNYGWGGMASTYFRIDPQENLIMIGMAQFVPIGFHAYHDDLRNLVYQALVD